jgi:RNA polymerase sigma-70 factor (ECF subfamily)
MSDPERLAEEFRRCRPRLVRVAYAVLGSVAEAEDVVSDCWVQLVAADAAEPVRDVEAWLVVVVARRALSALRSARHRRESYVGPWLPEPLLRDGADLADPADRAVLDEQVSFALMVVLETLSPAERTAFVLHDLFGYPFPEVAEVVGRSPAAVRQLATRARRHVRERTPRVRVTPGEHAATLAAFVAAAAGGDPVALAAVLDERVVLTSDGGGQVRAALRPVHGPDAVSRFVLGLVAKYGAGVAVEEVDVNGAPGLLMRRGEQVDGVMAVTVEAGRITRLDLVRAPAKLPHP